MVGVQLEPHFYDDEGVTKLKVVIGLEFTKSVHLGASAAEKVSDCVSDFLDQRGIKDQLCEIGFDGELLDWYVVKCIKV